MSYPLEIVRFILSDDTVVSFYDTGNDMEIMDIKYFPRVRKINISVDRFGKARLLTPGLLSYQAFEITFHLIPFGGTDVMTKLKQIYDDVDEYFNPNEIELYWHYDEDPTDYVNVGMKREHFVQAFSMGDVLVNDLTITFIEVKDIPINDNIAADPMDFCLNIGV